jgi:uncharacterized protein GlcG (DUF336 family)
MAIAESVRLYEGAPTTSEAVLFTAKVRTVIRSVHASGDATGGTVSVSVVPKGGTAGAANRFAQATAVAAAASVDLLSAADQLEMNPGDFLSGLQSTGTHVTLTITGDSYGES